MPLLLLPDLQLLLLVSELSVGLLQFFKQPLLLLLPQLLLLSAPHLGGALPTHLLLEASALLAAQLLALLPAKQQVGFSSERS